MVPDDTTDILNDATGLSRASTLDAELSTLETLTPGTVKPIHDWCLRSVASNDYFLRESFSGLLTSSALLPPEQRLIMYDACDDQEVRAPLGIFRKRLDARRNTKPKKPDIQRLVCTPFGACTHSTPCHPATTGRSTTRRLLPKTRPRRPPTSGAAASTASR